MAALAQLKEWDPVQFGSVTFGPDAFGPDAFGPDTFGPSSTHSDKFGTPSLDKFSPENTNSVGGKSEDVDDDEESNQMEAN